MASAWVIDSSAGKIVGVTTPDTSAVRAWARSNGYDVADRGRLPADVTDAYVAAHGKGSTAAPASGKPATTRPAAKKKAPPAKGAAPAKKATRAQSAAPSTPPVDVAANQAPAAAAAPAAARTAPKPTPRPVPAPVPASAPVNDDHRLVALDEQLRALTERVAALEATAGKSNDKPGAMQSLFRRSR